MQISKKIYLKFKNINKTMNNDTAYKIRQATLCEHKRAIKKDNTNNIISLLMILTLIIGLSMITTIYCINWYITPTIAR